MPYRLRWFADGIHQATTRSLEWGEAELNGRFLQTAVCKTNYKERSRFLARENHDAADVLLSR